jgi:hypothetical protein
VQITIMLSLQQNWTLWSRNLYPFCSLLNTEHLNSLQLNIFPMKMTFFYQIQNCSPSVHEISLCVE